MHMHDLLHSRTSESLSSITCECTCMIRYIRGLPRVSHLSRAAVQVTHCPCAHADLPANLARRPIGPSEAPAPQLLPKGGRTAAYIRTLAGSADTPGVAVITAGRRGISRDVCTALREMPLLRAVVYIYCCEDTAVADLNCLMQARTT